MNDQDEFAMTAPVSAAQAVQDRALLEATREIEEHESNVERAKDAPPTAGPPSDIVAERYVVGSLLLDPEQLGAILPILKPTDFYDATWKLAYAACIALAERTAPIDAVSVWQEMKIMHPGGPAQRWMETLFESDQHIGTTFAVEHQARRVAALATARRVIGAAERVARAGCEPGVEPNEFISTAIDTLQEVLHTQTRSDVEHISSIIDVVWKRVQEARRRGSQIIGTPTGFTEVDRLLLGVHRTDLIVLAARPAMGKTALALNIGINVAMCKEVFEANECVMIFSLEMGKEQLGQRMLASFSRTPLRQLRTGQLSIDEEAAARDCAGDLSGLPILIDDTPGLSINELRARARHASMRMPPRLIVVDYLQLMTGSNVRAPREQQVSECARGLKLLAKELNCTVVGLAQLNREVEKRGDKRPMMSDLRESGAIEQDADVIAFLYREFVYNTNAPKHAAELIVSKHRAGECGTVPLQYDGSIVRFESATNY